MAVLLCWGVASADLPRDQVKCALLHQPNQITDANNITQTNTFDLLDRITQRSWPGGGVERFVWAVTGLAAYTNQNQRATLYTRDEAGRLLGVTNANLEVNAFAYNGFGQLTNLWDGRTNSTQWTYNEFGWLINKVDALGRQVLRLDYFPDGTVSNRSTPEFGNAFYVRDALGNALAIRYPQYTNTYSFDPLSRLRAMTNAAGVTVFAYTQAGELQSEGGLWSGDTVYNNYRAGLRTDLGILTAGGGSYSWFQTYGYGTARRLTSVVIYPQLPIASTLDPLGLEILLSAAQEKAVTQGVGILVSEVAHGNVGECCAPPRDFLQLAPERFSGQAHVRF